MTVRFSSGIIWACAVLGMFACRPSVITNKPEPPPPLPAVKGARPDAEDGRIAREVKAVVLRYVGRGRDAVQAKEAVAAMAAVVGERCIDAAGEFPVRGHAFVPGQRVFSDKVNALLAGDAGGDDIAAIPDDSVFGTIRDRLGEGGFRREHFPRLADVFAGFASRIGKPEDWGKVPLSLPAEYWPERFPLRAAFDTRQDVDAALRDIGGDKARSLRACALAMAMMLEDEGLANRLDPSVALALTFEMINGMAKTAPITDKAIEEPTRAMREAQHKVIKMERR
jgi:hypothetical protein